MQDRTHIDHFARQAGGKWLLTAVSKLGAEVELSTLGCSLSMAEVDANVTLPEEDLKPDDEASV